MKTVILTPEVSPEAGNTGAFVWHFTRLLRQANHEVHIVATHPIDVPDTQGASLFQQLGVTTSQVHAHALVIPNGYKWHLKVAEVAAHLIPADADVVYCIDWDAAGTHLVRSRRFNERRGPVVVNILLGCTKWRREGFRTPPYFEDDLWLDYSERYVVQHSDYVASPSRYMLQWVQDNGWVLPDGDRVRVLGMPLLPTEFSTDEERLASPDELKGRFERIVFFGRLESRQGIDLFVSALIKLRGKPCMQGIKEVVLLGSAGPNPYGTPDEIANLLEAEFSGGPVIRQDDLDRSIRKKRKSSDDAFYTSQQKRGDGVTFHILTGLNAPQAQAYLMEHASDSLVVVPCRQDNMGFEVIEASLIVGLNLICSNIGAISEVLEPQGQEQIFEPFSAPLTRKLETALLVGPRPAGQLGRYDWEVANQRWLAFHEEVCAYASAQRSVSSTETWTAGDKKLVDVCVTYYNLAGYLPYLLESLTKQTMQDFRLFVINDGSTNPEASKAFANLSQRYQRQGWHFVTTDNQGLSAARNYAASLGDAEYLIFADADNVAAPTMVERFLQGILCSGDDCLTCYIQQFRGEGSPQGERPMLHPQPYLYTPVGNDALLGIFTNTFGDANCIIRRPVYNAIGGFTSDVTKEITGEDWELFARLSLKGYRLDVIPEFLLFYRYRPESMNHTTDAYLNHMRVLRHYEERLRQVRLEGLATFALGIHGRLADRAIRDSNDDLSYLVNHVSGYKVLKALQIKVRNQVARRLGL